MAEDPIGDFLRKVTAERKPLSEQERKEAMKVGKEIWSKAAEKTKGRDSAVLELIQPDCTTIVYVSNPRHIDSKYNKALLQDSNTDLVIDVLRFTQGLKMTRQDIYDFSPGKVTKLERHTSQADHPASTEDPELALRNYIKRVKEQTTEEQYDPGKQDLQSLLDLVSSAQEPPSAQLK